MTRCSGYAAVPRPPQPAHDPSSPSLKQEVRHHPGQWQACSGTGSEVAQDGRSSQALAFPGLLGADERWVGAWLSACLQAPATAGTNQKPRGELWSLCSGRGGAGWRLRFVNKSCVRMCLPAGVQPAPCAPRNCVRTLPPAGRSCGTPGPGAELRKTQTSGCFCFYFKVHTAPPTHPSTGFGDATPTPYGSGPNVRSVAPGLQEGPPLGTQRGVEPKVPPPPGLLLAAVRQRGRNVGGWGAAGRSLGAPLLSWH